MFTSFFAGFGATPFAWCGAGLAFTMRLLASLPCGFGAPFSACEPLAVDVVTGAAALRAEVEDVLVAWEAAVVAVLLVLLPVLDDAVELVGAVVMLDQQLLLDAHGVVPWAL